MSYDKYSRDEILKLWKTEDDMKKRDELFKVMQEKRIFPREEVSQLELEAGLYPATDDPDFIDKLMHRQEFAENLQDSIKEQQKSNVDKCKTSSDEPFEISSVQRFVSRFLSPKSPYRSALLYHGVGVGKTCAAIVTAEEHLNMYPDEPVFIIAPRNIHSGFRRTIYNEEILKIGVNSNMNELNGCTGNSYLKRTGMEYEREKEIITRRITSSINKRYLFFGYVQFANYIKTILDKKVPKSIDDERRRIEEIKVLRDEFDGRMIIIDEAHNLRDSSMESTAETLDTIDGEGQESSNEGKLLTPSLIRTIKEVNGIKLMLLTGTPMYNNYREIIFLINLLLLNDNRPIISERDIFLPSGKFVEGGEERLGHITRAYVSFMRGENPLTFPIRLKPESAPTMTTWATEDPIGKPVEDDKRLKESLLRFPFVPVSYSAKEKTIVKSIANNLIANNNFGLAAMDQMIQAGNWLFPAMDKDTRDEERIRDIGFDSCFREIKLEGVTITQFESNIDTKWLLKDNLKVSSPKTAFILNRIATSKGLIFIYTRFIKSGAIPIAIALEANGYTIWGRDRPLFKNGIIDGKGRQCALCKHRETDHANAAHKFTPAKYILLTGQTKYSPNNPLGIEKSRLESNKDGGEIKVIIGSQVASEGIDLRFVREIYVFDSWFHLNKMEQVLGRGVRTCSHSLLDETKRNCTIHLLIHSYEDEVETADMYMYRIAMTKAIEMGSVTRVLKRYATDCNLNHKAIVHSDLEPIERIEDSQGNIRNNVSINDTPFSSICDWMECSYTCSNDVNVKKLFEDSKVTTVSYDEYSMSWRESQIKGIIKRFFEEKNQVMIQIDNLFDIFKSVNIPEIAIKIILSRIVNKPSFVLNVNGQDGYLTYKNTYYLFQPMRLIDKSIPIAFRVADTIVRKDEYIPKSLDIKLDMKTLVKDKDSKILPTAAVENYTIKLWNECVKWAKDIQTGKSSLDIPPDIEKYMGLMYMDESTYTRKYIYMTMISWIFEVIQPLTKDNTYNTTLGEVLLDLVWDEFMDNEEQKMILNDKEQDNKIIKRVSNEQQYVLDLDNKSINVFLNISLNTGKIEYSCDNSMCSSYMKEKIDSDDSVTVNKLKSNIDTTGTIYGYLILKSEESKWLIFKTNKSSSRDKKGQDCVSNTSSDSQLRDLNGIRDMIIGLGYPPFFDNIINNKSAIKSKAVKPAGSSVAKNDNKLDKKRETLHTNRRNFKNAIKACALKNIILRLIDIMENKKGRKRYFYRPISAVKTGHLILEKKTLKKSMVGGNNVEILSPSEYAIPETV